MELTVLDQGEAPAAGGCSKGACGSTADQMSHLPKEIADKVRTHPCYSEEAHHHYARMHVAVAPACNIQCNYCNRKYDCANESRPGVVSELLSPEQAADKVVAVAAAIPQTAVVGIAGPGDPLANPERVFDTFRRLMERTPDIKLCISTNGLALPDHVDELAEIGVDHVTITINCLDPDVGAKIYPWIFWNHRRVRGRKAAEILIRRQMEGLEKLVDRGVLVKVNSVMIPGINDEHLKEVSRVVKEKGAFLHNVMPLIAEPEHGTYYGLMGQPSPTKAELQELQDSCAGDMNMMRHCRQCRADAVGLLGEDRGQEFSLERIAEMEIDEQAAMEKRLKLRDGIEAHRRAEEERRSQEQASALPPTRPVLMAIATSGHGLVNQHFGHATEFLVYEASPQGVRHIGQRSADPYCTGAETCDEGEDKLARVIKALEGCEAVLCSKIGYGPWKRLEEAGLKPDSEHGMESIEDAVMAVYCEMIDEGLLAETSALGATA